MENKNNIKKIESLRILSSKLTDWQGVFERHISIPTIGDNICLGSDFLRARDDVTKANTKFSLFMDEFSLNIGISDFTRSQSNKKCTNLLLGLVLASGIKSVSPLNQDGMAGYDLIVNESDFELIGTPGGYQTKDDCQIAVSESEVFFEPIIAERFSDGCLRAMQKILQNRLGRINQ